MMKLQDVILKALAKRITWLEAAEIIGVCDRTMRRMRERYQKFGYDGLFDQRHRQRTTLRVPLETAERVLQLYQETYFDLSVRHFHEKLRDEHAIELSYTWVKQALQGAGLVVRRKKRGPHRRRRPRRPFPGMLLHIDGSKHRWLSDDRYYDLLVILDDATSEIYYAQLVAEESTRTVMAGLREVIETKGLFCALYSDRGSHFFVTPKVGEKVDKHRLTQVGRAMKDLGIQMIPAYSPQARGRSERSFGTWQNRLPQELRLAGIDTLEQANFFLRQHYIEEFNQRFSQPAAEKGTAFRKCQRPDLDRVFSIQTERVVAKDNTVTIQNRCWQLRMHGDDLRTPGRAGLHSVGTACAGNVHAGARRWKRRRHRRLGNLAQSTRFPLCPPPDDGDAYTQTKDKEQSSLTGQIPCQQNRTDSKANDILICEWVRKLRHRHELHDVDIDVRGRDAYAGNQPNSEKPQSGFSSGSLS
ncbi:MAG: ISNCY family transposase, partial [Acidobacteriaceae bacterium]|nr:ISNCY family transposase [Acidobacteriaceae bacterium]